MPNKENEIKMSNKIEIGKLISGEIKPKELDELRESFNEIQRSLAIEQKNNKKKCPLASGKTMSRSYY